MKNFLIACMAVAALAFASCQKEKTPATIETKYGLVQGFASDDGATMIYRGIPYAAAPVGDLRWRAPQPPQPWEGVLVADKFSAASIQPAHVAPTTPLPDGEIDYVKEFFAEGDPEFSEDCLYLNIWAPADATPESDLPVAVWIHGGAFVAGFGFEKEMDGEAFAKHGVILVTINYRLGPLGFASHPSLTDENGQSGNYGILDQIAAIDWVRDNIKAFGGNPDDITVFGQSAGAMSVRTLLSSPLTEGKIAKAIIQSGGGIGSISGFMSREAAEAHGVDVYGDMSADELRALTPAQIDSLNGAWSARTGQWMMLSPVSDGVVVSEDFSEKALNGSLPNIPIMIGYMADDMIFFRNAADYQAFAEALEQNGHVAPYVYEFARKLPGDNCGAFHSGELWYVFGTLDRCWRPFTEADYQLSERVVDNWTNFVKTGNPNTPGTDSWKPCTAESQYIEVLDVE